MSKLSGAEWVKSFPGKNGIHDLNFQFRCNVERFCKALKQAGARVVISSTLRPPERAYLMHWAWMIANKKISPDKVPAFRGVNINWVHESEAKSIAAANAMVNAYDIRHLRIPPALRSRHTEGNAIDMNISWDGVLAIENANGEEASISIAPRDGMNPQLHQIAKTYGVVKFRGGNADKPHWSNDGR